MRVLLTNDDGVAAEGLATLARALVDWTKEAPANVVRDVLIVAPNRNFSGMSSAVGDVFERPTVGYRRHRIDGAESFVAYGLDASPALCVILGALGSFNFRPDLVVSGINAGANVGRSVLHSGTIGAVLTGAQFGLSGLAVSVQWGENVHYDTAASLAVRVLSELEEAPTPTLLNLNVPNLTREQLRGIRRGRISSAGVVAAAGPLAGGDDLGEEGTLPLRLGAATPRLGDVRDEAEDDDGALLAAGFASLTALRGPHEDVDGGAQPLLERAVDLLGRELRQAD